jgi:hypothetical protein
MREWADLVSRIDRLSSGASSHGGSTDRRLQELEELMAEGCLAALRGDAQSRRLAARLERLVEDVDHPEAALEVRRVALEKRGVDERIRTLRERVAAMRAQLMQLRRESAAH